MAQVGNNQDRFGGEFMIQDRDHMSEIVQPKDKANRGENRQVEQTQSNGGQQGSGDNGAGSKRRRPIL